MAQAIWINEGDENVRPGSVGFLREHYRPGAGTTYTLNPNPVNLAGKQILNGRGQAWNNCNITALGLARVTRRAANGRCLLRRLAATKRRLKELEYPELAS